MNTAEDRRNERIAKMGDLDLLNLLIADATDGVRPEDRAAFADMRGAVADVFGESITGRRLSKKQRAWAEEAARRVVPVRAEDAPRGREVLSPDVLKNLPKAPPGRKART